jgi:hypothetical protein
MRASIRRTSPALAVALVALFVSLGGVSFAVATGSIGSREIKDGSVRGRDIKNSSLRGRDIRDGSLQGKEIHTGTVQSRDIRDGSLRGVDVNDHSLGGVDLATDTVGGREVAESRLNVRRLGGVDAARYVRNVRQVEAKSANDSATPKLAPPARCPDGKHLVGGGARIVSATFVPVALTANAPSGNAWVAAAYATAPTGNWQLVSVAICG